MQVVFYCVQVGSGGVSGFAYLGSPGEMRLNWEMSIGGTNSFYNVCYLIPLNPGKEVD